MDYLSWILTFAVVGYTAALTVKTGGSLYRYRKAKNKITTITGEIFDWLDLETVKRKEYKITTFYPVFKCVVDGKTKTLNGNVRWAGNPYEIQGRTVDLLYNKETEELWCKEDLPLMVKQIKVRITTAVALVFLMILTSIIL